MDELDSLRKKKMELMQQQYAASFDAQAGEEQQLQQQIAQLEFAIKQMMTPEALQRYSNVKLAHPEKAVHALVVLAQMVQRTPGMINDAVLKNVLVQVTPNKKETKLNLHGAI